MFRKVVVKDQSATHSSRTGIQLLLTGIAILTLCQSVGCSGTRAFFRDINEATMLTYRDVVWSRRAYNLRYANCDRQYADHFQNGFQAGYVAISTGGDGYVPALPPQDYRAYEFQSADGAKCVNSWFEGYPAGVAAARHDKSGTYHDVLISRMINSAVQQEKSEAILPSNVPIATVDRTPVVPATNAQNNMQASFQDRVQNYRTQASALAQQRQYVPPRAKATPPAPSLNQMGTNQVATPGPMAAQRYTPPQANTLPPVTRPKSVQSNSYKPPVGTNQTSVSAPMNARQYMPQAHPAMPEYSIMKTNEPLPMAQAPGDGNSTHRIR
jgi:hypothetical protein